MSDDAAFANPLVTLELVGPPDVLAALGRHPALRGPKGRRPRARALRQTWHDTADHGLAGQDLALSEAAGLWHVERLGAGWPRRPGTPSPVLAASIHPAGLEDKLGQALPGPLHPVARLTGQRLRLTPTWEGTPLECRILSGTLTAITPHGADAGERAIVRAEIEGPLVAALALARLLAIDLPVTPSLVTLPQEALLLAGAKLRPLPAPALDPEMPTDEALGHPHLRTGLDLPHPARPDRGAHRR